MVKSLTPPHVLGISEVQKSFDTYQLQAFEPREPAFFALELAGECGELANLEKKLWRDPANPPDFAHLADEAADVLIALVNYCNTRGIDLQAAAAAKLAKIEHKRINGLMGPVKE